VLFTGGLLVLSLIRRHGALLGLPGRPRPDVRAISRQDER
jgi:hypothetical protein